MVMNLNIGDIVRLKKVHPCGDFNWEVVRVGADIGIKCLGCERRVIMPRSALQKRIKTIAQA